MTRQLYHRVVAIQRRKRCRATRRIHQIITFIVAKDTFSRCQVAFLLGWVSERGTNNKPPVHIELRTSWGIV
jgi:hypothetical protein